MIWNPEYECMDRAALHQLQLRRLQMTTSWAYERVPHYRAQMDERGVRPRDIRTLDDVRRLPFTDESALRDTFPFGMFALPLDEVVRVHSSSGTTGKPVVVGYSRGDINTWTELTARVAAAAGVQRGDLVQMAFPYGMSTGGWGMHYGIERIGATIIPAGAGQTRAPPRHDAGLRHDGARLDAVVRPLPRRAGRGARRRLLVAQAQARALRRRAVLRPDEGRDRGAGSASAPPTTTGSPRSWARASPASASAPAACTSTRTTCSLEIVDPATGEPLEHGEQGELVITTLTKEAFPLLRYRTHDLTALDPSRCECGRTLARMRKVRQRTDDMLIVRGVNVLPEPDRGRALPDRGRAPALPHRRSTARRASTTSRCASRSRRTSSPTSWPTWCAFQSIGRRQAAVGPRPARAGHARGAGRHRAHRRQAKRVLDLRDKS